MLDLVKRQITDPLIPKPSAGRLVVFLGSDGKLYGKDEQGNVTQLNEAQAAQAQGGQNNSANLSYISMARVVEDESAPIVERSGIEAVGATVRISAAFRCSASQVGGSKLRVRVCGIEWQLSQVIPTSPTGWTVAVVATIKTLSSATAVAAVTWGNDQAGHANRANYVLQNPNYSEASESGSASLFLTGSGGGVNVHYGVVEVFRPQV